MAIKHRMKTLRYCIIICTHVTSPARNTFECNNILDVNLWREQLKACGGEDPSVTQRSGTVLGQVFLPQVTRQADDPGVLTLRHMGKHPDVGGAYHIKLVADGRRAPLCQSLKVYSTGTVQQICLQRRKKKTGGEQRWYSFIYTFLDF